MILAVLQARMSSSRLPGKVMAPVLGQPMFLRQVERLRRSQRVTQLVLATSVDPSDDPLAECARAEGLAVVRGSLDDVRSRFLEALDNHSQTEILCRLTADCPLTDWRVLDAVIDKHRETGADYTHNTALKTYPHGLDVEAIRPEALRQAAREEPGAYEREHVTPVLYKSGRFKVASITRSPSLAHLRWTVDFPQDLAFVRHVYESLYPADPDFGTEEIAALPWNTSQAGT
jgi:spore coat polysaccharide biosynthesis protein SpsF